MRKTGRKWRTEKCGRCFLSHSGYSGKLDKNGVEYVVCGQTHKRMNVSGTGLEAHSFAFPTVWVEEEHDKKAANSALGFCTQYSEDPGPCSS